MNLTYEAIAIGFLQGVFEWLPVSSKTIVMLYSLLVLSKPLIISYIVGLAVQGGTVFAAVAYFWRDVLDAVLFRNRRLLTYLAIATSSTCLTGLPLYILITRIFTWGEEYVSIVTISTGVLLLVQAVLLSKLRPGMKSIDDVGTTDSFLLGLVQGLAVIPGVSRSGITVIALLLLGYAVDDAFRLSFLASIPINIGATFLVLSNSVRIGTEVAYVDVYTLTTALLISAIVGFLTIKMLIGIAKKYKHRLTAVLGVTTLVIGIAIELVLR